MLEHGGRRLAASRRHGIAPGEWLDLSTGVSPWSWVAERGFAPSTASWSRLPEDEDGLEAAARDYYGAKALPIAGSQAAIQCLPRLRARGRVGMLHPTYAEHAEHWARAGHGVMSLSVDRIDDASGGLDVLVLCNPNNPDGQGFAPDRLLEWHARLAARGGWLVVDEAFADAEPGSSLARETARPGLVVLRSLGKFFGLAGARVGFALCGEALRASLREAAGPWCVSGPSREIANAALRDCEWQALQRWRLVEAGQRLATMLTQSGLSPQGGCALFQNVRVPDARAIECRLAQSGVLVRAFDTPPSLRLGLPGIEAHWHKLERSLAMLDLPPRP